MKSYFGNNIIILLASLSIASTGCYRTGEFIYHDPLIQMHEYDFIEAIQNKEGRKMKKQVQTNIRPSDAVYTPEEPKAIEDKVVSINVTEEIPIVDVIMELARMSGTDVQIDPTIIGGVNLNLRDKPLRDVFNRICGLTDIRYREKYGIVVFERDIPYTKTYHIDFLDVARNITSSITLNTSGLSSSSASGGGSSTVTATSTDDFWKNVADDIRQIIQTTENTNKIYTSTAARIQKIAKDEDEANKLQEDINNGIYNKNSDKNNNRYDDKTTESNNNPKNEYNDLSDERIRINKRAGLITITASTKSHRKVEDYIKELERKAMAQVLIEMRFLEINLSKEYSGGINWQNIGFGSFGKLAVSLASTATNAAITTLTFDKNSSLNGVAKLFEKFGTTRTLSSPRITAVNNQPALMTFTKNHVYFKVKATYTPPTYSNDGITVLTAANTNVDSEAQTMPLGIIMSVVPSIDIDKHEVMLNIRPTISKISDKVEDPAVSFLTTQLAKQNVTVGNIKSEIPIANVRELDTILKLKDGQVAVMGGFTERVAEATSSGVPVLKAIPIFGNLFNNKESSSNATETIILVKATIVDNGKKMSDYDKKIYDNFSDDPRMNEV